MGKLTQEKEEQILKTYRKVKSYTRTAKIEDVDPRTVAKLVKKQHLAEDDASGASAQGTAVKEQAAGSNTPALSRAEATKTSPAAAESTTPKDDRGLSSQEIEATVVELYRNNRTPLDAVVIYKISMDQAESLYKKFLQLQLYEQFPEMRQEMDEETARDYLILAIHMRQEGLEPAAYVGDLKRFDVWRSRADQLPAVEKRLRDLQERVEDKESKLEAVTKELAQGNL